jgi:hypothetical protein
VSQPCFLLASAYCTRARTLGLDSECRPTAGKSISPAGLSTLVYAYVVVDRAPASPYTYSSSKHRFPDERTPVEATCLFQRHLRCFVWVWVWVWDWVHWHTSPRTRSPSSCNPPVTHYPFPPTPPRSLVCGSETSPHKPRLVVSHSTCPQLSSVRLTLGTLVRIHTHIHMCTHTREHTNTCTLTRTRAHTHTHTHTSGSGEIHSKPQQNENMKTES